MAAIAIDVGQAPGATWVCSRVPVKRAARAGDSTRDAVRAAERQA